MKTRIRRLADEEYPRHLWILVCDDSDVGHTHAAEDNSAHGFPCTREQLETLRDSIAEVLKEEGQ